MTECNPRQLDFSSFKKRKVQVDFEGGDITSDAGVLLLREVDKKLGMLERAAKLIPDERDQSKVVHSMDSMIRQRVLGIAQGYEDLNDHDRLRDDLAIRAASGRDDQLAGSSTLCRMENKVCRKTAMELNDLLVSLFIESHDTAPEELILDFDVTDDPVHGNQQGRFFHGYYRNYCFLPLYVFCGSQPLFAWLRPANIDGARGAWAALKALVKRLRGAWPKVRIVLRADSGFCRWRMLSWCENNGVDYIVGLAKNSRVSSEAGHLIELAGHLHQSTGAKQRLFGWITYKALKWDKERMVIAKAEHSDKGSNPRYVITSLKGDARELYDKVYCARGDMENRIKEQQLGLFADRTSCHRWWPNQLRLLLSTLAYVLVDGLRRLGLAETEWATEQVSTLRCRLLKAGAVVVRNTRRFIVRIASGWPGRDAFVHAHNKLSSA